MLPSVRTFSHICSMMSFSKLLALSLGVSQSRCSSGAHELSSRRGGIVRVTVGASASLRILPSSCG